jgi:hypothetical protein
VDAVERQRETQSNHSSNPELAATVQGEQAASAEADGTQQHAVGPGNQGFSPEQEVTAQEELAATGAAFVAEQRHQGTRNQGFIPELRATMQQELAAAGAPGEASQRDGDMGNHSFNPELRVTEAAADRACNDADASLGAVERFFTGDRDDLSGEEPWNAVSSEPRLDSDDGDSFEDTVKRYFIGDHAEHCDAAGSCAPMESLCEQPSTPRRAESGWINVLEEELTPAKTRHPAKASPRAYLGLALAGSGLPNKSLAKTHGRPPDAAVSSQAPAGKHLVCGPQRPHLAPPGSAVDDADDSEASDEDSDAYSDDSSGADGSDGNDGIDICGCVNCAYGAWPDWHCRHCAAQAGPPRG